MNNDISKVSWGKTSWLALIAALAQFAAAIVVFLFAPDDQKVGAAAPLATAASTLYALIKGRMDQASAKMQAAAAERTATPVIRLNSARPVEVELIGRAQPTPEATGALGGPDEPYYLDMEETMDERHEVRDLHDTVGTPEEEGVDF